MFITTMNFEKHVMHFYPNELKLRISGWSIFLSRRYSCFLYKARHRSLWRRFFGVVDRSIIHCDGQCGNFRCVRCRISTIRLERHIGRGYLALLYCQDCSLSPSRLYTKQSGIVPSHRKIRSIAINGSGYALFFLTYNHTFQVYTKMSK